MKGEIPVVLGNADSTDGSLKLHNGQIISVGSNEWLEWLDKHDSFRFVGGPHGELNFTARKHERQASDFWYAYKKVSGKLKNAYLGKPNNLTIGKLSRVALKLSETPKCGADEMQRFDTQVEDSTTEQLGSNQEANQVNQEVLQQLEDKLAAAQAEIEQLRSQLAEVEPLAIEWQQKRKVLKDLLAKVDDKQKGYQTRNFAGGIKDLRKLV
jgi:hypothetical protein